MMGQIASVKCTGVMAQVNLGFYDDEGNLVGEETFPQAAGKVIAAKLFHPHQDQLGSLIETCIQQAWEKINTNPQSEPSTGVHPLLGEAGVDQGVVEREGSLMGARP